MLRCDNTSFFRMFIVAALVLSSSVSVFAKDSDYCIVGSGPSGLQMGYFLQKQGRDYVIYERHAHAGSFYDYFPRHQTLISINKRNTGRRNKDFNLRHDWNSILSDDDSLLFTKYAKCQHSYDACLKEYFPKAPVMKKYLNDYRTKLGLNVKFNTVVSNVTYSPKSGQSRFTFTDQHGKTYGCRNLIVGTGLWNTVKLPYVEGNEFTEDYESFSTNPDDYENKRVLIIGTGNSAFETALSIYGSAAFVHIVGRKRVKLSWDTHYVGDLRGVNNEILDAYQLKSLDGVIFYPELNKFEIQMGPDGLLYLKKTRGAKQLRILANESASEDVNYDHFPLRMGYHKILTCTGFKWNPSIFHQSMLIKNHVCKHGVAPKNKYPEIKPNFESPQYPNLYFIGGISHSLDFRKSSGGFIHGFRYSVRALSRLLDVRNHAGTWPSIEGELFDLTPRILLRANTASGIYQMYSFLADVVIINKITGKFTYLEEFPLRLLPEFQRHSGHSFDPQEEILLVWTFQYGANFSRPGADNFVTTGTADLAEAHMADFLHPVLYVYDKMPSAKCFATKRKNEVMPQPVLIHHIIEDFTTEFNGATVHTRPLRMFLEFATGHNLRNYLPSHCLLLVLTTRPEDVPLGCRRFATEAKSLTKLSRVSDEDQFTPYPYDNLEQAGDRTSRNVAAEGVVKFKLVRLSRDGRSLQLVFKKHPFDLDPKSQDDEVETFLQTQRENSACYYCTPDSEYVQQFTSACVAKHVNAGRTTFVLFHLNVDTQSKLAVYALHEAAKQISMREATPATIFGAVVCHEDDCQKDFKLTSFPQIRIYQNKKLIKQFIGPFDVQLLLNLHDLILQPKSKQQTGHGLTVLNLTPALFPVILSEQKPIFLKIGASTKFPRICPKAASGTILAALDSSKYADIAEDILKAYGLTTTDFPVYLHICFKTGKVYAIRNSLARKDEDVADWFKSIKSKSIRTPPKGQLAARPAKLRLLFDYLEKSYGTKSMSPTLTTEDLEEDATDEAAEQEDFVDEVDAAEDSREAIIPGDEDEQETNNVCSVNIMHCAGE